MVRIGKNWHGSFNCMLSLSLCCYFSRKLFHGGSHLFRIICSRGRLECSFARRMSGTDVRRYSARPDRSEIDWITWSSSTLVCCLRSNLNDSYSTRGERSLGLNTQNLMARRIIDKLHSHRYTCTCSRSSYSRTQDRKSTRWPRAGPALSWPHYQRPVPGNVF